MSTVIILRESAIKRIVRSRAARLGCSVASTRIAVQAAVNAYKLDRQSAHRAIHYGTNYARALADFDGPQTAA